MLENIAKNLEHSENIAFVIRDVSYSYKELGKFVNNYYCYLLKHPEINLVGIVMHNDIQTYAFIVATFLTDCGYVILNLTHPLERNNIIAAEANLKHVVSSVDADKAKLPDFLNFQWIDAVPESETDSCYTAPNPDSTAYILFTSGSTGNPKGVKISKKNVNAFVESLSSTGLKVSETDKTMQLYDLTFDASILMLLPPLCAGATIYTTELNRMKIIDIARVLTTYPITYLFLVPSIISLLRSYMSSISVPSLDKLLIGGEPVTKSVLDIFMPCIPNAAVWNFYGPTETTVGVVILELDENIQDELYNDIIPIGKPMPGVKHLIVDNDKIIEEINLKGELFIGGDQVTEGYVNDEIKNQTSFRYFEYDGNRERFYGTGDIVFMNKFGNYAYCGRKDHQVKIQGYRIELSEIEFQAKQVTGTRSVALVKEIDGNSSLFLFVENYQGSDDTIIKYLEKKLPPFMVPRNIVHLDQFPVTSSDKIDRVKLYESV